jgi:myo-inositol-1(or 4)-monophosphatase
VQPTLDYLRTIASTAGNILKDGYGEEHQIGYKGVVDLVTEVDHHSEAYLLQSIREGFPEDTIISEETGELNGAGKQCWYVDPLDGTVNYAHGIPIFAVSIAYADAEGILLGVVYDPLRSECFSAERGKGAWLNGRPIHVSETPDLIHSLLVTGFPYDMLTTSNSNLDNFSRLSRMTQGVRRLGSASLDLCYVAAGRFEGYWELKLGAWDIAAGILIAREAGAVISDINGEPEVMQPPYSILVANPHLHPVILAEIRKPL